MASSRRTYDTDFITLRTVYAKNADNSTIPALRALTADGKGGTTWLQPSSFATNPSFNKIITTGGTYTADLSFNTFRLFAGQGVGMVNGPAGLNQTYIYSKAFNQFDISGGDSLLSFSNNILTPHIKFATGNNSYIQLRTDSDTNTIFIDGPMTQTISTGYYGFNKFVIIPTVSTIQSDLSSYPRKTLFADSQSTQITFAGVGDLLLSTNYSTNQVFFSVSSFTAAGYLALSGETFSMYNRIVSTISSGFVTVPQFSTGAISLSTNSFSNASSVQSSIYGISTFFAAEFAILTGLINARATIVQLDQVDSNFQTSLSSFSTNYVSYTHYLSSSLGITNQISTTLVLSSISSLYLYGGTLNNFSAGLIIYDPNDVSTLSSVTNSRIISTASTLAVQNVGNLQSTFSTVLGLGTLGYVSTSQLFSTVAGLGTLGYVSTSYSDNLLRSTTTGVINSLGSYGYISSQTLTSTLQSTTQGVINSLGSYGYISTAGIASTTSGLYNTFGQTYLSTSGLNTIIQSSITGLGTLGYVCTNQLTSSFNTLFTYNLISTPNLQSTIDNLGTVGYLSTVSLEAYKNAHVNLRSSILYAGNNGPNTLTLIGDDNYLYVSSATVNFDGFSSFIRSTSQISFDANINVFLEGPADGTGATDFYGISTFLFCHNTIVPTTLYADTFHIITGTSNIYSKMITMNISTSFIQKNYRSSYNIVHSVTNSIVNNYSPADYFNTGVSPYMASTNSLFVTILNP
jgi:hypothetical protein